MAKYTVELRQLIENNVDIGMTDYPIYDPAYRVILNKKIKDRYFMREIGAETPELFKLFLNRTLHEIMPYYNELYRTSLLIIDPMSDYRMTELTQRANIGETAGKVTATINDAKTASSTAVDDNFHAISDTPAGLINAVNIKANLYASSVDRDDNTQTMSSTQTDLNTNSSIGDTSSHSLDEYIKNIVGATGRKTPGEMLSEFRKTIINIDIMVLNDLSDCFMGVY